MLTRIVVCVNANRRWWFWILSKTFKNTMEWAWGCIPAKTIISGAQIQGLRIEKRKLRESTVISWPKWLRNCLLSTSMKIQRSCNIEGGARHSTPCSKIIQFQKTRWEKRRRKKQICLKLQRHHSWNEIKSVELIYQTVCVLREEEKSWSRGKVRGGKKRKSGLKHQKCFSKAETYAVATQD